MLIFILYISRPFILNVLQVNTADGVDSKYKNRYQSNIWLNINSWIHFQFHRLQVYCNGKRHTFAWMLRIFGPVETITILEKWHYVTVFANETTTIKQQLFVSPRRISVDSRKNFNFKTSTSVYDFQWNADGIL